MSSVTVRAQLSAAISVFASTSDVRKVYRLNAGKVESDTAANMRRASVNIALIPTLSHLKQLLSAADAHTALTFGLPKHEGLIVTQAELQQHPGAIARDREHFDYAKRPGLLFLDIDHTHSTTPPANFSDARAMLSEACPALDNAPMLWRPSSSSYIDNADTRQEIYGLRGQHVYTLVADATDIPRAGAALFKRLWLAGYCGYVVSKSGHLLERGIVDASVWQPERLVFIARPLCDWPLKKREVEAEIVNDGTPFDSTLIKDLAPDEEVRLEAMQRTARDKLQAEVRRTREAFIEERALQRQEETSCELEDARQYWRDVVENDELPAAFELQCDDGQRVTVEEVLQNPDAWHGKRFADPIEPDYRGDNRIAWLNCRTGGACVLFSHAHGGVRYTLQSKRVVFDFKAGDEAAAVTRALHVVRERGELFEYGTDTLARVTLGKTRVIDSGYLTDYLGRVCQFRKFARREKKWFGCPVPPVIPLSILARRGEWRLPALRGVLTQPTLRSDGSLLNTPGYDVPTGLFYWAQAKVPPIPEAPTDAQAREALRVVWRPFEGFDFVDDVARGVWLAAIFTAVLRPALPVAPAFAIDAPMPGTGKTLLARCLGAIMGVPADLKPPPATDEELRKVLFASLLGGTRLIVLDNVVGTLDGRKLGALNAFITAERFSDRVLKESRNESLPNTAMLVLNGNNMHITGDLVRRVLRCRIDARTATPYARRYDFDPVQLIRERHSEYVAAVLTLLRAVVASGDAVDESGIARPFSGTTGSFEHWDTLVRQAVGWAARELKPVVAFGDPTAGIGAAMSNDPHKEKLGTMLRACLARFGTNEFSAGDVMGSATDFDDDSPIAQAVLLASDDGTAFGRSAARLGGWLNKRRDEPVDGLCFSGRPDSHTKSTRWRVERV